MRSRALAIVRERYADFGPTLACEKIVDNKHLGAALAFAKRLQN